VGTVEGARFAMTRVAVLGSAGMLGRDLVSVLAGKSVTGFSRADLDVTKPDAVVQALQGFDTVINATAYTKVDEAEAQRTEAFAVNAEGPENIARACHHHGSRLIHVSTDYVFDGMATTPYDEGHPRNPQSVYGQSKAEGEERAIRANPDNTVIIRTAWLYGAAGSNFVKTLLTLASQRDTIDVVMDQIGQPTWSRDLASMIKVLLESDIRFGIFHGTNAGQASWWDFAQEIFSKAGLDKNRVRPVTSSSFPRPAPRPAWSVLGHDRWSESDLPLPRRWEEAFAEAWPQVFSPGDDR
jgi:dTDP-4-dehydrorhamnose reductase